jgi:hypothetical protein
VLAAGLRKRKAISACANEDYHSSDIDVLVSSREHSENRRCHSPPSVPPADHPFTATEHSRQYQAIPYPDNAALRHTVFSV